MWVVEGSNDGVGEILEGARVIQDNRSLSFMATNHSRAHSPIIFARRRNRSYTENSSVNLVAIES